MNKQSAHGLKGLRTFPTQAANVISSAPVCTAGEEGDCNLCAMGHYCPNASAKPRVRVCLGWSARQLENAMLRVLLPTPAESMELRVHYAREAALRKAAQKPRARVPTWASKIATKALMCYAIREAAGEKCGAELDRQAATARDMWTHELLSWRMPAGGWSAVAQVRA